MQEPVESGRIENVINGSDIAAGTPVESQSANDASVKPDRDSQSSARTLNSAVMRVLEWHRRREMRGALP